jgi:hypothetical protein
LSSPPSISPADAFPGGRDGSSVSVSAATLRAAPPVRPLLTRRLCSSRGRHDRRGAGMLVEGAAPASRGRHARRGAAPGVAGPACSSRGQPRRRGAGMLVAGQPRASRGRHARRGGSPGRRGAGMLVEGQACSSRGRSRASRGSPGLRRADPGLRGAAAPWPDFRSPHIHVDFSTILHRRAAGSRRAGGCAIIHRCGQRTNGPILFSIQSTSHAFSSLLLFFPLTRRPNARIFTRGGGNEPAPAPTAPSPQGNGRAGAETPGGTAFSAEKARPGVEQDSEGRERHTTPVAGRSKPEGGGGRKRSPRRREVPWRGENPGEDRVPAALIPRRRTTDFRGEQHREAGRGGTGREPRHRLSRRHAGRGFGDESHPTPAKGKPPKGGNPRSATGPKRPEGSGRIKPSGG